MSETEKRLCPECGGECPEDEFVCAKCSELLPALPDAPKFATGPILIFGFGVDVFTGVDSLFPSLKRGGV